jgi:hypothetical protein
MFGTEIISKQKCTVDCNVGGGSNKFALRKYHSHP